MKIKHKNRSKHYSVATSVQHILIGSGGNHHIKNQKHQIRGIGTALVFFAIGSYKNSNNKHVVASTFGNRNACSAPKMEY